jgi:arylsulfatase A
LGYGDLGCYGSPTIRTPQLDRMAHEGLKLTQFYVAAPLCSPSRASMLTGRLPVRSGTYTALAPPNDDYMRVFYPSSSGCTSTDEVTIAAALRQETQAAHSSSSSSPSPYRTGLIGKWHMGHNPYKECLPGEGRRGFDSFLGLPYSHEEGYPGPAPEGLVWPPVPLLANASFVEQPFNSTDLMARYTAAAISFVSGDQDGGGSGSGKGGRPFFLHLAYEAPHVPLFTGPRWEGVSRRGFFGDAVEEMDDSVGQVLDAVRALDKNKDTSEQNASGSTLVLFTSDNGAWVGANTGLDRPYLNSKSGIGPFDGGSNGLLRGGKGSTWEGGMRVPCLVWWPGVVPPASVSMAVVSALDLFPTFLNLARGEGALARKQQQQQQQQQQQLPWGAPSPPPPPPPPAAASRPAAVTGSSTAVLDGYDMGAVWADPNDSKNAYGPWYDGFLWFWRESEIYAVRRGRHKLHWVTRSGFNISDEGTSHHDPPLVFDVESDPMEATPLTEALYPQLKKLVAECDAAREEHLRVDVGTPLPPAQYGPQDWSLVPCCDRGSFDPAEAAAAARAGEWGLAVWDACVCEREE